MVNTVLRHLFASVLVALVALAAATGTPAEGQISPFPSLKPKPQTPPPNTQTQPRKDDNSKPATDDGWDDDWDDEPQKKPEVKEPKSTAEMSWDEILKSAPMPTDADVRKALTNAILALRKGQNVDGSFTDKFASFEHGETALALLALRSAGASFEDPNYRRAISLILDKPADTVYANSLIAQVLTMEPEDKRNPLMKRRLVELARYFAVTQLDNGMWAYGPFDKSESELPRNRGDNSNTQFAVLGLWKLNEASVPLSVKMLKTCEEHFMTTQSGDGGWAYSPNREYERPKWHITQKFQTTPSMTATGVASLYIFADMLHLTDEGSFNSGRAAGCGKEDPIYGKIDRAMVKVEKDLADWFAEKPEKPKDLKSEPRQPPARNRALDVEDLYYLYSVARVGAASGSRSFGKIDWYARGAQLLLSQQNPDGTWGMQPSMMGFGGQSQPPRRNIVETSLAVLFLAKGSSPLFYNKLRYNGDWANDRHDVSHATEYASRELEKTFNWQVVDVRSPVNSWMDAPVLYISGHEGPKLSEAEKKKLKEYVGAGNTILAEACCGKDEFTASMKKLGSDIWPDRQWQELPKDHPLFTSKSHIDLRRPLEIWALVDSDGRAFFLLSPKDLSCVWNQNLTKGLYEDTFRFGINVYRYATRGARLRPRLDTTKEDAASPASSDSSTGGGGK